MSNNALFIGIMSGTSLDGADAILCDFSGPQPRTLAFASHPYSDSLRQEALALCMQGPNELERAGHLSNTLSRLYAELINQLLHQTKIDPKQIKAIGSHGQTVRHRPESGFTIQLQQPALLAELTGITVVADFRNRDIAAGGQGAPLVPAFHVGIFGNAQQNRAVVNIGGISNMTVLNRQQLVIGFDCGPGNVLMDSWISAHQQQRYDMDGKWAASAQFLPDLLQKLMSEPYFSRTPPKSTGRELFNTAWLESMIDAGLEPAAVQATLLELTASAISQDIQRHAPETQEVIICGGGAYNQALMQRLSALLSPRRVMPSDALGVPAQHVEAMAFAWLAKQAVEGKALAMQSITGARHPNVLGAIYPA